METTTPQSFTSLGMLVIDEVHLPSGEVVKNVMGGSGAYACLGARLFSPASLSTQVGYTLRKGYDFPQHLIHQLRSWGITLKIIEENSRTSTRGELHYLDSALATKSFSYTTPILPIEPEHLEKDLFSSDCFHFFLDPTQIVDQVSRLLNLRQNAGISRKPIIVWEPKAYSCVPENLQAFVNTLQVVDVFSPNHIELAQIVGKKVPPSPDARFFEELCSPFMSGQVSAAGRGSIMIRAGDQGCYIKNDSIGLCLPAYHVAHHQNSSRISRVVDTTGAGNAFLGAFAIGYLQSSGDIVSGACAGNVGASFALEQIGVPTMTMSEEGNELWNGEEVSARLNAYKEIDRYQSTKTAPN